MAGDAGRAMEDMKNGAENMARDVGNGARNVGEATKNTVHDMTNTGDRGYTAARTSANSTNGVTGAIIIALVWYYGRQTTHSDRY